MTNLPGTVRVHVHWGMKVMAVLAVIFFPYMSYLFSQHNQFVMSILAAALTVLAVWVFFLADTKIDVDQTGIQITAPHGVYVMHWAEIRAVGMKGQAVVFLGGEKALGYNLLLAGEGKDEFETYVAEAVHRWRISTADLSHVSNAEIQRMIQNTKVRGFKLF